MTYFMRRPDQAMSSFGDRSGKALPF